MADFNPLERFQYFQILADYAGLSVKANYQAKKKACLEEQVELKANIAAIRNPFDHCKDR